jgi:hypothetical protein
MIHSENVELRADLSSDSHNCWPKLSKSGTRFPKPPFCFLLRICDLLSTHNPKTIASFPAMPNDNPKGIESFSPGLRRMSYPGFEG